MATDTSKQARQAGPEGGRGGDDANGDERGNQAILNRSRTGLVVCETSYNVHSRLLAHVIRFAASSDALRIERPGKLQLTH